MDLNELFCAHQVALIEGWEASSAEARRRAEERLGLYEERICSLRRKAGAEFPLIDRHSLREIYAWQSPMRNASLAL